MELGLGGKVALVTGASAGLGRAIAAELAAEGAWLAVLARRAGLLEALADEIAATGAERPLVIVADVTEAGTAARARDAILARFGRCDCLVNNAGGSRPQQGLGADEAWEEAMALNFTAGRRIAHALVAPMQANRFGRIVNITGQDEPHTVNAANAPNGAVHI
jgi:3-oxoacyl-[acyl-carrier protein] reductase